MFELPLFPLNTVLFPGMPLSLHIFEERYKAMIGQCVDTQQPFGIALIRRGAEAHGPLADPHSVGCTAKITQVQQLAQGTMNIAVVGQERIRILALNYDQPYLVGTVETFPLEMGDPATLRTGIKRLRPWLDRYLRLLTEVADVQIDVQRLPSDPLAFAYVAAIMLQMPPSQKQPLLASLSAHALLADMLAVYRREVALLREIASKDIKDDDSPFSPN